MIYKNAFKDRGDAGAEWLEKRFAENNWTNAWRNGVFDYHHYHSNTHEVLGVYSGKALLQFGGESGEKLEVTAGVSWVLTPGEGNRI